MTNYVKRGNLFLPQADQNLILEKTLPNGAYTVKYNPDLGGFYLEEIESYAHTGKVYGNYNNTVTRIINTFNQRTYQTGVLLTGEKGSGKTLLAKLISIQLQKEGIITILINQEFAGELFNTFISNINQPALIIFDEFEKIYDKDHQAAALTLFDGTHPSKKLFIVTANDKWSLDRNMVNRPGRFFYALDYDGLGEDFILEYCEENLKNKTNIQLIIDYAKNFLAFNFDMLQAIVEEMNRYNESLSDVIKFLNVSSIGIKWAYKVNKVKGPEKGQNKFKKFGEKVSQGQDIDPFKSGFYINLQLTTDSKEREEEYWSNIFFKGSDITDLNSGDGTILANNGIYEVEIERIKPDYTRISAESYMAIAA